MKEDMLKKLHGMGKKKISPIEKTAKTHVLNQLKQDMQDMLSGKMAGLKKVTVAAPDNEGMEKGLDTAKHLLATHTDHDEKDPSVEDAEENLGEDLDHDDEDGESEHHKDMVYRQKPNEENDMHESKHMDQPEGEEPEGHEQSFFEGGEVGDFEPHEGNFDEADEDNMEDLDAKIAELMKKRDFLNSKKGY